MKLSDTELCLLEQLIYINAELLKVATSNQEWSDNKIRKIIKEAQSGKWSVIKLLNTLGLDERGIINLRKAREFVRDNTLTSSRLVEKEPVIDGAFISAKEWASIIETIRNNNKIANLKVQKSYGTEETTLAIAVTSSDNPDQAIVAFKGTSGKEEWKDNVKGMDTADTKAQKKALEFVEGLEYADIVVTGHSKGSNKSMYVAILCDRVSRCVGFDGQGFSQKFFDKYSDKIKKRVGIIKNYSLSTDFVHPLLFSLPGVNIYVKGYGVDDVPQNHSPNSFFVTDNGNIVFGGDGTPFFEITKEDPGMTELHRLVEYLMVNLSSFETTKMTDYHYSDSFYNLPLHKSETTKVTDYLSKVVSCAMSGEGEKKLKKIVFSDPDALSTILALLVRYKEEYGLTAEDINQIILGLGIRENDNIINIGTISEHATYGDVISALVDALSMQLEDRKSDPMVEITLQRLLGVDAVQFNKVWEATEMKLLLIKSTKEPRDFTYSKSVKQMELNPFIIMDTAKLREYKQILGEVKTLLSQMDTCISDAHLGLGYQDLFEMSNQGYSNTYGKKLDKCMAYLEHTADNFENVEKKINNKYTEYF